MDILRQPAGLIHKGPAETVGFRVRIQNGACEDVNRQAVPFLFRSRSCAVCLLLQPDIRGDMSRKPSQQPAEKNRYTAAQKLPSGYILCLIHLS